MAHYFHLKKIPTWKWLEALSYSKWSIGISAKFFQHTICCSLIEFTARRNLTGNALSLWSKHRKSHRKGSMFHWNCSKLWFWADSSRDRTNELDIYTKIFIDGTNLFPEKSYRSQKIEFEVSIRIFYLYGLYKTQRNYILQERMNRLNSGNPLSSICVGFMTVLRQLFR